MTESLILLGCVFVVPPVLGGLVGYAAGRCANSPFTAFSISALTTLCIGWILGFYLSFLLIWLFYYGWIANFLSVLVTAAIVGMVNAASAPVGSLAPRDQETTCDGHGEIKFREPIVGEMGNGTIRTICPGGKAFGLIDSDFGVLIFFASVIGNSTFENLRVGRQVEFEIGRDSKGPCAVSVRLAKK